jgi:hypothetical protein
MVVFSILIQYFRYLYLPLLFFKNKQITPKNLCNRDLAIPISLGKGYVSTKSSWNRPEKM